ncbi:unnamed protein product, partial [Amoebophrya sp. A25]
AGGAQSNKTPGHALPGVPKGTPESAEIQRNPCAEDLAISVLRAEESNREAMAEELESPELVEDMMKWVHALKKKQRLQRSAKKRNRQKVTNSAAAAKKEIEAGLENPAKELNEEELAEHIRELHDNRRQLLEDGSSLDFAPGFGAGRVASDNKQCTCDVGTQHKQAIRALPGLTLSRSASIKEYGLMGAKAICGVWSWYVHHVLELNPEPGEPGARNYRSLAEQNAYKVLNGRYIKKMRGRIEQAKRILRLPENRGTSTGINFEKGCEDLDRMATNDYKNAYVDNNSQ